ncbi:hypothetical protein, partial [Nocardia sp. NPDC050789]
MATTPQPSHPVPAGEDPASAVSPASSVIVETIPPARIGTRLVHPVLRTTLQQFLRAGAWVADLGPRPANL